MMSQDMLSFTISFGLKEAACSKLWSIIPFFPMSLYYLQTCQESVILEVIQEVHSENSFFIFRGLNAVPF